MGAPGTFRQLAPFRRGVELVTTDAMEGSPAPLLLEAPMITPVVVEPQAEKDAGDQQTVKHDGGGELEHDLEN